MATCQRAAVALVAAVALLGLAGAPGVAALQPQVRPCNRRAAVSGSVVEQPDGTFRFLQDGKEGVAWGSYVDGQATASNFGQLSITTSGAYSDEAQVYAAGYLEGVLTAPRIYDNWRNMLDYFTDPQLGMNVSLEEPMKWIEEQDRWVRGQCSECRYLEAADGGAENDGAAEAGSANGCGGGGSRAGGRRFWQSVCLLLRQFDGLVDGYQAEYGNPANEGQVGRMQYRDFLFVMSNADLYDVIDMLDPSQGPTWAVQSGASPTGAAWGSRRAARHAAFLEDARRDPQQAAARLFSDVALSGKCSALVKVAADLSDILIGHATWDTYTAALRIFKHYNFHLKRLRPAANRVSFSSYPGELFSDDDFYILDSKLVIVQTTNKIFNHELFEALDPHTVLSWQRVRTANWLAGSGKEWAEHLKTLNSGTYNNQYMVVDLKKFKPREEMHDGLLWVVEQIPGLVVDADMTPTLALGYWPSFNVPFFPEVYNRSGYPDFISKVEKYGQHFSKTTHWLSYQSSPRAKIFRRDQSGVRDLQGIKALMRSNDWRNDPFSEGHPICAVCGRGDLDPEAPVARGCYDTKVTNYEMALKMEAEAVNGPTTGQGVLPPFDWRKQFPDMLHHGQPRRFVFEFERMSAEAAVGGPAQAAGAGGCGGGPRPEGAGLTAQ